ncbi:MAG: hypothetical protein RR060_06845, partial [Victivallaceae bacterium]
MNNCDIVADARKRVNILHGKIFGMLLIYNLVAALGVAGFAAGILVMAKKLFFADNLLWYGVGACGLLALIWAFFQAERKTPDCKKLLIWLDANNSGYSGWMSTALEADVQHWSCSIHLPEVPKLQFCRTGRILPLSCGLLFLLGALLIPVKPIARLNNHKLDINEELQQISEKLELLKDEQLLVPEQLERLEASLTEIVEKNRAEDSARTYEALDKLNRKLDRIGEENALTLERKINQLSMVSELAEQLTENLANNSAQYGSETLAKANAELADLLKTLAQDNPELAQVLKELAQMVGSEEAANMMNPGALKNLKNLSAADVERLKKMVEKMKNAKLVKRSNPNKKCKNPGNCDGSDGCDGSGGAEAAADADALEAWLMENGQSSGGCENLSLVCGNCENPGNCAAMRGRGDAGLNLSGNTSESAAARKQLDLSRELDPAKSSKISQQAMRPDQA